MAPAVGLVGRSYIPSTGAGWGASDRLGPALGSTRGHMLSLTSSNTTPHGRLLQSHTSPSSAMCPKRSAKGYSSIKGCLCWLPGCPGGSAQQQCRHIQEKTQMKRMIPKISDIFFPSKAHDPNHWFIKSPRPGVRSLSVYTCVSVRFNKDDALAYSSGMNTQQSAWLMAQMTTCKAVMMSKAILFGRQLFSFETFKCSEKTGFVHHLRLAGWI